MNEKDREEFFDLKINVALLLSAWSRGDDRQIQEAIELLDHLMDRHAERMALESREKKVA